MPDSYYVPLFGPSEAIFEEDVPANSTTHVPHSSSAPTASPLQTSSNQLNPSTPQATQPRLLFQWPACYQGKDRILTSIDKSNRKAFIKHDLNVDRLNVIHKHLWLAGLPLMPRPLHLQVLMGRHITVTEKCDLHLLWRGTELYLKPLPEYLLSHATWTDLLCLPSNHDIYKLAAGLIYSYISLIMSPSDLRTAHRTGLLPESVTWQAWTNLAAAALTTLTTVPPVLPNPNKTPETVNTRYIHGELRLARINLVYRFFTTDHLLTGYHHPYTNYAAFFAGNFAWVVTVVVYVTVLLTAMQVGLATQQLQTSRSFNRASFGFTVFAIVGPLAVAAVMGGVALLLVGWNLRYALSKRREARVQPGNWHVGGVVTATAVGAGGRGGTGGRPVAVNGHVARNDGPGDIPLTNLAAAPGSGA